MRVAIMSDIHGNSTALQAVRQALPPVDAVYVAGDLCLEGPLPDAVVDGIRELGWFAVTGNTDRDIVDAPADLKPDKAEAVTWARQRMGPERIAWLADLPFSLDIRVGGRRVALVVHANPLNLHDQLRPDMADSALAKYADATDAPLLAFGHLHIPYTRPVNGVLLVDVSSVGHPKDLDRRAAFTVIEWTDDTRSVTQVRVPYDLDRAVEEIRASDMPHAEEEIVSLLRASY